jgi:hypothetical protein
LQVSESSRLLEEKGGGPVPPIEEATDFETGSTGIPLLLLLEGPEIHADGTTGGISESSWKGLEWCVGAVEVAVGPY